MQEIITKSEDEETFKVGDVVECIAVRPTEGQDECWAVVGGLRIGDRYKVRDVENEKAWEGNQALLVAAKDRPMYWQDSILFKKVKSKLVLSSLNSEIK